MKNFFLSATIILFSFLIISCENDPCDEGYTQVTQDGIDICLPDYVVNSKQSLKSGDTFYHHEYGIITFQDDKWYNESGDVLKDLAY